jgi:hypothetical protein
MAQIFTDLQTEKLWADVEAARAVLLVAEIAANDSQSKVYTSNQELMDAQNELNLALDKWIKHTASRTKVKE